MCFNQKPSAPVADYTLGETKLETMHESKYLGVIIQSDLKFTTHIKQKVARAKQLGMIKRALYGATKKAKLLVYVTLCRPLVGCSSSVWDSVLDYQIYDIEMVQHHAVRFICDLKGRASISAALDTLELDNLSECSNKTRHDLLTILSSENCHKALSYSFDELKNRRLPDMAVTRAVSRGEPQTM